MPLWRVVDGRSISGQSPTTSALSVNLESGDERGLQRECCVHGLKQAPEQELDHDDGEQFSSHRVAGLRDGTIVDYLSIQLSNR